MAKSPRPNCKFERNIEIYCLHTFEGLPYYTIGSDFGLSPSRIHQICDRVIAHIHKVDMTYIDAISEWEDSAYGKPSSFV